MKKLRFFKKITNLWKKLKFCNLKLTNLQEKNPQKFQDKNSLIYEKKNQKFCDLKKNHKFMGKKLRNSAI